MAATVWENEFQPIILQVCKSSQKKMKDATLEATQKMSKRPQMAIDVNPMFVQRQSDVKTPQTFYFCEYYIIVPATQDHNQCKFNVG